MRVSRETIAQIRLGVRDTWLVALGLIPLGLAFGVLMTQTGFAWWWTPIFSTVIYAGSMEFLAVSMVTGGLGPVSSAITGFMVNFRHLFYGLTYPRSEILRGLPAAYATYALTDEVYAITSTLHERPSVARLLTISVVCQLAWLLSGIAGALAGAVIPAGVEGFDFALTALFAVLAYEAFQTRRDLSAPLIAGTLALVAALLLPGQVIILALLSYFLVLVLRFWFPRVDDSLSWRLP
ncbi:AzlC family ABC transporter permease [Corynebacterium fournieri]|uniref:AzlC family ABC transporter permease n=1 Tax=Corynebacterium fournieri TaxID=1852390 RepID=UPI001E62E305|nr:AzlC family ABC transporter permease [Corynebacterium fournieri]WJY98632.1 Inner membrane protein YgaZ [Corynebacterium fournieri]